MAIIMQSTLEFRADGVERFGRTMAELVTILEGEGWRLITAFVQISGRLHTGVDVWELRDLNHYASGLGTLRAHPRFDEFYAVLAETIERETVVFAAPAAWLPEGRI